MRVIGGNAKGRRLLVLKGPAVRPTAVRVKDSLFNILPRDLAGMTVLDLFAGTGNLTIEALSRGAAEALLVEISPRSADVIRENLRRFGYDGEQVTLWVAPVARTLRALAKRSRKFDLIFLDPPYDKGLVGSSLEIIGRGRLLNAEGTVIAEHSAREVVSTCYDSLVLNDQRHYGDTRLSFFQRAAQSDFSL
ncbi:MAG: 16S rRNA (guanine(966)-N(2))-methyltransferase RsmD [Candidatus Binatia bacterium]